MANAALQACPQPDTAGNGTLRLTPAANDLAAAIQYTRPLPTANGLDIRFKQAQWGGTGADGIAFFLKDGANTDWSAGNLGPGLGYAPDLARDPAVPGVKGALFGVGFDVFGNHSLDLNGGPQCTPPAARGDGFRPNTLVIRGGDTSGTPGHGRLGLSGYCRLAATALPALSSGANTRQGRTLNVRITVDPTVAATTPMIRVYVWQVNTSEPQQPTLAVSAPAEYLDASTFTFGFAASTGALNNNHEIWDLSISESRFLTPLSVTGAVVGDQLPVGSVATVNLGLRGRTNQVLDGATDTVTVVPTTGPGAVAALPAVAANGAAAVRVTGTTPGVITLQGAAEGYSTSGTVTLTVVNTPSAPTAAPSVTLSGREARISVQSVPVASAGAISAYHVYALTGSSSPVRVCTIDATASPLGCTATGLAADTTYTFTYRAANAAGESGDSPVSASMTTPPPVSPMLPLGMPTVSLTAEAISCASPMFSRPMEVVTVEWLIGTEVIDRRLLTSAPFTAALPISEALRGRMIVCRVTGTTDNALGTVQSAGVTIPRGGAGNPSPPSPEGDAPGDESDQLGPDPTTYAVSFQLFSAALASRERRALRDLLDTGQRRFVIASFVPANRGPGAMRFNLNLSRQRAANIAAFLRSLDGSVRITVLPTRVSASSARTAGTVARVNARP